MNNLLHHGHLARKRFGQHFLHDRSIIDAMVTAIHPQSSQAIVEIGPGLGALTKPVAECINKITVIELDRDLAFRLASNPFLQSKLKILQQDAMTVDFTALSAELGQPIRVFGNLPYNISTQLMFHLFKYAHTIHDMHFMLQKEIVNRLAARPHNKTYGRLSVMAQYCCQIVKIMEVPPASFQPKPKVNSAVVRLIPYAKPPFPVKDLSKLAMLTSLAFNQRRKILRNSLANVFNTQQLEEQGVNATLRSENVDIEHYCRLANAMAGSRILQD